MEDSIGYIKLYRTLLDWEWYDDINVRLTWNHLLLRVNYKPKIWRGATIRPGQLVTSRSKLAKEVGISEKSLRVALNKLKTTGEVAVQTAKTYTLITVVNWRKYQVLENKWANIAAKSGASKGPTKGQEGASKGPLLKKIRIEEDKNIYIPPISPKGDDERFMKFWEAYPRKVGKVQAAKAWNKINPDDMLLQTMLAKLELFKTSAAWKKDDGIYIPYPATWLNGKRWEDELSIAREEAAWETL